MSFEEVLLLVTMKDLFILTALITTVVCFVRLLQGANKGKHYDLLNTPVGLISSALYVMSPLLFAFLIIWALEFMNFNLTTKIFS